MASASSSVASALSAIMDAAEGERAVKKQHTASQAVENKLGQMGAENRALFEALTMVIDDKLDKKMDRMSHAMKAMAASTDTGVKELKKELDAEKDARKVSEADIGQKLAEVRGRMPTSPPRLEYPARSKSVGATSGFVAKKVYVQGFFDFGAQSGSLKPADRDALAEQLLTDVPAELRRRFKLEKRYVHSRRLVFVTDGGGEECWELREKLLEAISEKNITVGDKELKVRVEDAPERQSKRQHFWKAADALKAQCTEKEHYILEPSAFSIYDAKELVLVGNATEDGFEWKSDTLTRVLPAVDLPKLKQDTVRSRRQQ